MRKRAVEFLLLLLVAAMSVTAGCSPPAATLDLITVARQGIAGARAAQQDQYDAMLKQLAAQQAALDAAFDADIRLAAAGQITDASGKPVQLTSEWIDSARKGYTAARDALAGNIQSAQAANEARLDNLQAADEALDKAAQLIVQQQVINSQMKQQLLDFQRKVANAK